MNIPDQVAAIVREAVAAADAGKGPDACPYLPGSDAEITWKDAFYVRAAAHLLLPVYLSAA